MKPNPRVGLNTLTVRRQDIVDVRLNDGTAMLDLETGRYHILNFTASRIWDLLDGQHPHRVSQLCDTLEREFEVVRETCEQEVLGLLDKFLREKLVHVVSCEP
jgi:hypothetical protein